MSPHRLKVILTDRKFNEINHLAMSESQLNIDKRFDRIETKLDEVSKLLSELARIEERLVSSHKRLDRHEMRLDQLETNQRTIEKDMASTESKSRIAERFVWIAISVVAGIFGRNFL